jgi:hypothetical protein
MCYKNCSTVVFQGSVDRMMQRSNASMMVGASSWKDQFMDAFTVQAGQSTKLQRCLF